MQIQPKSLYHVFLTLLGLLLLASVVVLNHFHPRNQGIADLSHSSIYKIAEHNSSQPTSRDSTFAYATMISTVPAKADTNKLSDPTSQGQTAEVNVAAAPNNQSADQSCAQNTDSSKTKKGKPQSTSQSTDSNCQLPSSYPTIE